MSAHVTGVELRTSDSGAGIDVEVTIRRVNDPWTYAGPLADATDLPADVADALRKWLTGAPTHASPSASTSSPGNTPPTR